MGKTRRAGRKAQLRRITAQYYNTISDYYTSFIGVEYKDDKDYEELFKLSNPSLNKNKSDKVFANKPIIRESISLVTATVKRCSVSNDTVAWKLPNVLAQRSDVSLSIPWKLTPISLGQPIQILPRGIADNDPRRARYVELRNEQMKKALLKVSEDNISL